MSNSRADSRSSDTDQSLSVRRARATSPTARKPSFPMRRRILQSQKQAERLSQFDPLSVASFRERHWASPAANEKASASRAPPYPAAQRRPFSSAQPPQTHAVDAVSVRSL